MIQRHASAYQGARCRLDAHRSNLERDIADRTRDLREAPDAAEAETHAKSDFLATMSMKSARRLNGSW